MAIDIETFRPKLGAVTGGLSGPAIKPVAVRCVYQVAQAFPGVPIIGIGGISTADDAIEFLLAGAWAVQVGTATFVDPHAAIDIAEGIRQFLTRKGLERPIQLTGRVRTSDRVLEPAHRRG
jgi:dihydroorotate dehydrogenase (NAD+) catalytic subunit